MLSWFVTTSFSFPHLPVNASGPLLSLSFPRISVLSHSPLPLAFHGVESHGFMAPNHSLIYCLSTLVHESLGQSSLSVYLSDELVKHGVLGVWLQGSPTPLYMQRHGVQRAQQVCFGSAQLGTHGVLCPSALRHGQTTSSLWPQRHMPAPCVSLQGLCHLRFHTLASFPHDFQMSQGTGVLRWNSCPGLSGAFNDF